MGECHKSNERVILIKNDLEEPKLMHEWFLERNILASSIRIWVIDSINYLVVVIFIDLYEALEHLGPFNSKNRLGVKQG